MHAYRTHSCGELRLSHAGETARLSGWVHRKRDHGQLLFVDLRDTFGLTQCVIDVSSPLFAELEAVRVESVITVTGPVVERDPETVNPNLPTGEVELRVEALEVRSRAAVLPLQDPPRKCGFAGSHRGRRRAHRPPACRDRGPSPRPPHPPRSVNSMPTRRCSDGPQFPNTVMSSMKA
ncbi:MAG: hypothetical protein IIC57_07985 [Proteobacteria bacterium]|nr:hypothetical protein [Pseudomonadota bacterium]